MGMMGHVCHPALERLRQEDCHKFEVSLGYTVRFCLKKFLKNQENRQLGFICLFVCLF